MTKLEELRERQGNRCFYCHEPLHDDGDNPATLDHVIPRCVVKAIGEVPDNLVAACSSCNNKKADQIPEDWDGRLGEWQLTDFGNWVWRGSTID